MTITAIRNGKPYEYRNIAGHGSEWVPVGTGPLVWLQSYGLCPAKPVEELAVGDVIVYNFGHTASVVRIERASAKFLAVTVLSNGVEYTSRRKVGTLVGVSRAA